MRTLITLLMLFMLTACTSIPSGVTPINQFKFDQYLGTWYEVARIENSFERGLSQVTATYTKRDDGGVTVLNRGFNAQDNEWEQAEGRAYFVGANNVGHLKVSFFGPFYASYVVIQSDENHQQYAIVSGYNKEYLWLLSRQNEVPQDVMTQFMTIATTHGFNTEELVFANSNAAIK